MKLMEIATFTDQVEELSQFYRSLLGKEPVTESDGIAIFMVGEIKIFIHRSYEPGDGELPPENHLAYAVDNLDETCQQLVGKGISIEVEPKEYYWGKSAYLRSPDGQLIELIQAGDD